MGVLDGVSEGVGVSVMVEKVVAVAVPVPPGVTETGVVEGLGVEVGLGVALGVGAQFPIGKRQFPLMIGGIIWSRPRSSRSSSRKPGLSGAKGIGLQGP